jgi:hypothetical protein
MSELLTTSQIAQRIGVTSSRVRQIAKSRGIVGVKYGNTTVYRESLLSKFKRRPRGRPRGHTWD